MLVLYMCAKYDMTSLTVYTYIHAHIYIYKVNYNDHRVTQALKENICALFYMFLDAFISHF